MKRILTASLLSCVLFFAPQARTDYQKRTLPNFSGTWKMEPSQTSRILKVPELTLIITQQEPEIRIKRKFTLEGKQQDQELVYFTDGRGESNLTLRGGTNKSESRTRWKRDSLVMTHPSYNSQIAGQTVTARMDVEWRLLAGGGTLVEKLTTSFSNGTSVDASISASDRTAPPRILPPTLIFERVYAKVP